MQRVADAKDGHLFLNYEEEATTSEYSNDGFDDLEALATLNRAARGYHRY